MSNHQLFALFNGTYYTIDEVNRVVIPTNLEYKASATMPKIDCGSCCANIDLYRYHTDLVSECNVERVRNMKDLLLAEGVTEISHIGREFVIGVEYLLYNNKGEMVRGGTAEADAKWCMALLHNDVNEHNSLEYRKALVLDGRIVINIPDTVCYGIRNRGYAHPYTLHLTKLYAVATSDGYKCITETGTQVDNCNCGSEPCHQHHATNGQYHIHHHPGLCDTNFNSCFLTNAGIGTTIIDSVVASAVLEAPEKPQRISVCEIPCEDNGTMTFDANLKQITLNIEFLLDNLNVVHDRDDITKILEDNIQGSTESEPEG